MPLSEVLLEQLAVPQVHEKSLHFTDPPTRLITMLTEAYHFVILSLTNPVHNLPTYFCNININIILTSHIILQSGVFPSCFPTKTLYIFLFSPVNAPYLYAFHSHSHKYYSVSSTNYEASHHAVFSSPLSLAPYKAQVSSPTLVLKHSQPVFFP
jgi:hypothetical protein